MADTDDTLPGVPEAFVAVSELAYALGVRNMKALPGCWEHQVDLLWWVAVNPHGSAMPTSNGGPPVPPFSVSIEFNGWPAGILSPNGGIIAAGDAANETTFIEAVRAAIGRAEAARA